MNSRTKKLTETAVLGALIAVVSPIAIPVGTVPITLATLAIMLCAAYRGPITAVAAVGIYLALGAVGLPIFSGFTAGFGHILGPTGGFLVGYLPFALICGYTRGRGTAVRIILFSAATAVLYLLGTAWYIYYADASIGAALVVCVLPALPGDVVKIAVAVAVTGRGMGKGRKKDVYFLERK